MPDSAVRGLHVRFASIVLLASAILGCGKTPTDHRQDVYSRVDARSLQSHGQLTFVTDPALGYELAANSGLPCLFFFTADWCTYCHRMADSAFADETVGRLSQGFVCVLVDADHEPELCQEFTVTGFPTVVFTSPNGHTLHRLVGLQSSSALAGGMRAALVRCAWINDSLVR